MILFVKNYYKHKNAKKILKLIIIYINLVNIKFRIFKVFIKNYIKMINVNKFFGFIEIILINFVKYSKNKLKMFRRN